MEAQEDLTVQAQAAREGLTVEARTQEHLAVEDQA